jgi:phage terminase small subunit
LSKTVLSPQQQRFLAAYMTGISARAAALEAGYSKTTADKRAYELLHQNPAMKVALAEARNGLQLLANYNADSAMADFVAAAEFAIKTNNANALVKATEMKARLKGLLIDRAELTVTEKLDVNATLREARARMTGPGRASLVGHEEPVDVEPKAASAQHEIFT